MLLTVALYFMQTMILFSRFFVDFFMKFNRTELILNGEISLLHV